MFLGLYWGSAIDGNNHLLDAAGRPNHTTLLFSSMWELLNMIPV